MILSLVGWEFIFLMPPVVAINTSNLQQNCHVIMPHYGEMEIGDIIFWSTNNLAWINLVCPGELVWQTKALTGSGRTSVLMAEQKCVNVSHKGLFHRAEITVLHAFHCS